MHILRIYAAHDPLPAGPHLKHSTLFGPVPKIRTLPHLPHTQPASVWQARLLMIEGCDLPLISSPLSRGSERRASGAGEYLLVIGHSVFFRGPCRAPRGAE